jgi:L-malate glycosyltransferase
MLRLIQKFELSNLVKASMNNDNILITIPCLLNFGTEIQTLNLINVLVSNGYKVTLACYYEFDQNIVNQLLSEGVNVLLFSPNQPCIRKKGIAQLLFLLKYFIKIKKRINPVVTHVQYLAPGTSTIILLKILNFKNIITTIHLPSLVYGINSWIPRFIGNHVTKLFICVSLSNEESYFGTSHLFNSTDLIKEFRHITIHNCLRFLPEVQYVKDRPHNIASIPIIGFIGRIAHQKGLDILIDAIPYIISIIGSIKLQIAGIGPLEENLKLKCKELEIENEVEWLGYLDLIELQTFYAQIDILAMPSRFEGFGLTAIEAMSFSKPVIASNIIGLNEVVTDETGILFEPESKDSLANAIITILSDNNQMKIKGENGKIRVDSLFNYSLFKEKYSSVYSQLTK